MAANQVTWFCIADAGVAYVKEAAAPGGRLADVATIEHGKYERGRYEAPGMSQESSSAMRHGFTDAESPVRREKRGFAMEVAEFLDERAKHGAFARLVLAAPPKFLGDLRAAASPAVRERIVGEIDKDLTKAGEDELADRFTAATGMPVRSGHPPRNPVAPK